MSAVDLKLGMTVGLHSCGHKLTLFICLFSVFHFCIMSLVLACRIACDCNTHEVTNEHYIDCNADEAESLPERSLCVSLCGVYFK